MLHIAGRSNVILRELQMQTGCFSKESSLRYFLDPSVHLYRALKLLISEESVKSICCFVNSAALWGSTVGREMEQSA
jgi:hypothetical protein